MSEVAKGVEGESADSADEPTDADGTSKVGLTRTGFPKVILLAALLVAVVIGITVLLVGPPGFGGSDDVGTPDGSSAEGTPDGSSAEVVPEGCVFARADLVVKMKQDVAVPDSLVNSLPPSWGEEVGLKWINQQHRSATGDVTNAVTYVRFEQSPTDEQAEWVRGQLLNPDLFAGVESVYFDVNLVDNPDFPLGC